MKTIIKKRRIAEMCSHRHAEDVLVISFINYMNNYNGYLSIIIYIIPFKAQRNRI